MRRCGDVVLARPKSREPVLTDVVGRARRGHDREKPDSAASRSRRVTKRDDAHVGHRLAGRIDDASCNHCALLHLQRELGRSSGDDVNGRSLIRLPERDEAGLLGVDAI